MKRFFSIIIFTFLINFSFAQNVHVCLGSFKILTNAQRLVKNLNELNEEAFIYQAQVNGQTMYRVLLSKEFKDKDDARSFKEKINNSAFAKKLNLSGLWICKTEKTSTIEEVPVKKENIVLKENENKIPLSEEKPYSVLVHSYKEEQAAENGKKRLQENNIDSYVLKTFDDKTYFSFDLHSGAFESEEQAEPLIKQLEEIGIEETKISNYETEKEKIEKYDEVIKTQEVVFDNGNTQIPELYSQPVVQLIKEFPINKNFSLEQLAIFDFDNIRAVEGELPELDELYSLISDSQSVHAASLAFYKDELFNKQVMIYISSGDENTFFNLEAFTQYYKNKDNEDSIEFSESDFMLKDGILKSLIVQTSDGNIFYGVNENKNLAILMLTEDFTKNEFTDFINNFENDSSLLIYPQVRRTLLVLPKNTDIERTFLSFTLEKINYSYVVSKDYANWSYPIVGHWNADAILCQEDEKLSVGFFDLDYNYNAEHVHKMFMNAHVTNEYSHSSFVEKAPSWYVNSFNTKEVSFSTKSYIIAVESYNLTEEDLVKLADELIIWDK